MASVLFSTIGQAIGGPLGLAVGAVVGNSLDSILFGPRGRTVDDIFIQRSAYGNVVPEIFGSTRTSGQLIWALPFSSAAERPRGQARGTRTSFAVALSARPIGGVGRIWADGREIRSVDGTFEVPTVMRVHAGGAGQSVDPLILSAEGSEGTPDFRGLAYVVFEDIDLTQFGSRIPNLNFEIFAGEDGPAAWLSEYLADTGIEVAEVADAQAAIGYSAFGEGVAEVGQLSEIAGLSLKLQDAVPVFARDAAEFEVTSDQLLEVQSQVPELQYQPKPSGIAFTYLDPERDYQAGQQRVARGRSGRTVETEAPVCAPALAAKVMAQQLLRKLEAGSETVQLVLPWGQLGLEVGGRLRIDGRGPWRVTEREVRGFAIHVKGERVVQRLQTAPATADSGRSLGSPLVPVGATRLRLFEAPVALMGTGPSVYAWVGGERGWRGAGVELIRGGEAQFLGSMSVRQPYGTLMTALAPGPIECWDERNVIILSVDEGAVPFESRSRDDVLNGANIALIGDELIQYCDVEYLDERTVRMTSLLRGRFGTAVSTVAADAQETLFGVDLNGVCAIPVSVDDVGRDIVVLASGVGDPLGGVESRLQFDGIGAGPMAAVQVRAGRDPDGRVWCSWVPRSADYWPWNSLDSTSETWVWTYAADDGATTQVRTTELGVELSLAEQIERIGHGFGPGQISVETVGIGPVEFRTSHVTLE